MRKLIDLIHNVNTLLLDFRMSVYKLYVSVAVIVLYVCYCMGMVTSPSHLRR
jgi:hypothetical protein